METTRLHAAERPLSLGPTSGNAALSDEVAAFSDSLRREHQRFLSAVGDATARLGNGARALAGTAALQHQLTRQFLDAQRSILLRHAETQAEIQRIERDAEADARAQMAAARRRSAAMSAHPASGARTAVTTLSGGATELLRCRAGEWVMVDALGTRLAAEWPPDNLDLVVESVAVVLGVRYGHYVHELRDPRKFEDWRMNDLDALSERFLTAVGIDAHETKRAEAAAIRDVVARHFHIS